MADEVPDIEKLRRKANPSKRDLEEERLHGEKMRKINEENEKRQKQKEKENSCARQNKLSQSFISTLEEMVAPYKGHEIKPRINVERYNATIRITLSLKGVDAYEFFPNIKKTENDKNWKLTGFTTYFYQEPETYKTKTYGNLHGGGGDRTSWTKWKNHDLGEEGTQATTNKIAVRFAKHLNNPQTIMHPKLETMGSAFNRWWSNGTKTWGLGTTLSLAFALTINGLNSDTSPTQTKVPTQYSTNDLG